MENSEHYDINADRGMVLYVSVWTMAGLTILTVVGRFSSRRMKGQPWLIDDWMALVALILSLGCCVCSSIAVTMGVGRHYKAIKAEFNPDTFWKLAFSYNQIYIMTGPVNKIAMLLMYRRIFDTRFFRRIVNWGIAVNVTWWLAMAIAGVFTRINVVTGKKSGSRLPYDLGYACVNIILDVFILVLPIREVWNLQLTKQRKLALSFIFLIGVFACVTALIRLLSSVLHIDDPDFTWVYLDVLVWTAIEPMVAVICICLPLMRPILRNILPARFTSGLNTRSGQSVPTKQHSTLVTFGSSKPKSGKRGEDYGFTRFDDDERGSQKALYVTSHKAVDSDDTTHENGIMVTHSVELTDYPVEAKNKT